MAKAVILVLYEPGTFEDPSWKCLQFWQLFRVLTKNNLSLSQWNLLIEWRWKRTVTGKTKVHAKIREVEKHTMICKENGYVIKSPKGDNNENISNIGDILKSWKKIKATTTILFTTHEHVKQIDCPLACWFLLSISEKHFP